MRVTPTPGWLEKFSNASLTNVLFRRIYYNKIKRIRYEKYIVYFLKISPCFSLNCHYFLCSGSSRAFYFKNIKKIDSSAKNIKHVSNFAICNFIQLRVPFRASRMGRTLRTGLFRSGRCYYQLLACVCRGSQRISSLADCHRVAPMNNAEPFLQTKHWLGESRPAVDSACPPVCHEHEPGFPDLGSIPEHWITGSRTVVLEMERRIQRCFDMMGEFLRPVTLKIVLKILNPFGHSWNTLWDSVQTEDNSDFDADVIGKELDTPIELRSMDD